MLYLFATDFHDLSHGDGRRIADLEARARMCFESWTVRQCGTSRSALSHNTPEWWTYLVASCALRFKHLEGRWQRIEGSC
jgi:hypothetical protein